MSRATHSDSRVSVVVPVRDEEATIEELLASLFAQTRQPDAVIIVDAGSRDGTAGIIERYAASGHAIDLIRAAPVHPGEARNIGVRHAETDLVAFTDAGIRLERDWLQCLCEAFERDPSVDAAFGSYEPVLESFFQECSAIAYVSPPATYGGALIRGPFIASSLMRRRVWEDAGGFPPFRAAEDLMFMEAVEAGGAKIVGVPRALVHWQIADSWSAMFRRFSTYSYHNLLAGRGKYWHQSVALQYLAALPFLTLGLWDPRMWLIPVGGFSARTARTLWCKRTSFSIRAPMSPIRWPMVAGILLVLDAATLAGALRYVFARAPRARLPLPGSRR